MTSPTEPFARVPAEPRERLTLALLCVLAFFVGLALDLALADLHPRLADVAGRGLFYAALLYAWLRWEGVARRSALVTAVALLAFHAAYTISVRPALVALWHRLVR